MATPDQRLRLLELAKPAASNPDRELWLAIALDLERYVDGVGHGQKPPAREPLTLPPDQARNTPPSRAPAPTRK